MPVPTPASSNPADAEAVVALDAYDSKSLWALSNDNLWKPLVLQHLEGGHDESTASSCPVCRRSWWAQYFRNQEH